MKLEEFDSLEMALLLWWDWLMQGCIGGAIKEQIRSEHL